MTPVAQSTIRSCRSAWFVWNADRTRFTVLFDPGRVKQGVLAQRAARRRSTAAEMHARDDPPGVMHTDSRSSSHRRTFG